MVSKVTQPCPATRVLLLKPEAVVPGEMRLLRERCLWESGSGGADANSRS